MVLFFYFQIYQLEKYFVSLIHINKSQSREFIDANYQILIYYF